MIVTINLELCNSCGRCDEACPMDVIYMNGETDMPEIQFLEDCMTCYNCEIECALGLIYVDPSKIEKHQPWKMA